MKKSECLSSNIWAFLLTEYSSIYNIYIILDGFSTNTQYIQYVGCYIMHYL